MSPNYEEQQTASSLIRLCGAVFVVVALLTPACILVAYADWAAPIFSTEFFASFKQYPWFRLSFAISVVTILFPFCALSPAWGRLAPPIECSTAYAGGALPVMFFVLAPMPYPLFKPYSDILNGWAFLLALTLHGTASHILATHLHKHFKATA